jgi:hypothetical protein
MRFTFEDHSATNVLDITPENMTYTTHVLDVINGLKWVSGDYEYFQDIISKINNKMSSPESSLVLKTLFDQRYFKTAADSVKSPTEKFLGSVLWRKNSTYFDYVSYPKLLKDYKRNEIKQCLGLSFNDYINLTPYEKMEVDKFSAEWSQEMAKMMQQQQNESDDRMKDYRKSMERVSKQQSSIGGGMDILGALSGEEQ